MTTQKLLLSIDKVPKRVKDVFNKAVQSETQQENLWRDVAARAILDSLGMTGLTGEPTKHNMTVREARMWFKFDDDCQTVFDLAGLELTPVKEEVIKWEPFYFEEKR